MQTGDTARQGECRCARVRFEALAEPVMTAACHCTGCQRMTGSAFSLSALYPSDSFRVTAGEPVIGGLHGDTQHYFCDYCMSWLFSYPQGLEGLVNVRATMLDDPESLSPFIETCLDEKLSWVETSAPHGFAKFPAPEELPQLLAAFANRAG